MVKSGIRRVSFAVLALSFAAALSAKELAEYRFGDELEADIVTPVALRVTDPQLVETLTAEAVKEVPAILQSNPNATVEVEEDLRVELGLMRTNFLEAMSAVYKVPKLNPAWLSSHRFQMLFTTFTNQHRDFPRLAELVPLWAQGKADGDLLIAFMAPLRGAMSAHIRPEAKAEDIALGPRARFVTNSNPAVPLLAADVEKPGEVIEVDSVLTLADARAEFQKHPQLADAVGAKFLAKFLKPTVAVEVEWTRQERARYVDAHVTVESFQAGDKLAERGQLVDAKLLAALNQLRLMNATPTVVLPPQVVVTQAVAQVAAAPHPPVAPAVATHSFNPWWLALVPVVVLPVWWLTRRKRRGSLLPARVAWRGESAAVISCPSCHEEIVIPPDTVRALVKTGGDDWEQRALAAEHRVHRAQEAMRTSVLKQFALWLRHRFLHGLISDRTRLLDTQQQAAAEMAELERRLDELHAPLRERLRAYEKRVSELEKSLAAKDAESRELIRARIRLTRQQLESEETRGKIEMN